MTPSQTPSRNGFGDGVPVLAHRLLVLAIVVRVHCLLGGPVFPVLPELALPAAHRPERASKRPRKPAIWLIIMLRQERVVHRDPCPVPRAPCRVAFCRVSAW